VVQSVGLELKSQYHKKKKGKKKRKKRSQMMLFIFIKRSWIKWLYSIFQNVIKVFKDQKKKKKRTFFYSSLDPAFCWGCGRQPINFG
jgi:hypothetical protein